MLAALSDVELAAGARPLAAVAVVLAGQLDRAAVARRGESAADGAKRAALVVSLSREVRAVLADLPLSAGVVSDDGPHDKPVPDVGIPVTDGIDAELADIVGAGPTVGHAPLS